MVLKALHMEKIELGQGIRREITPEKYRLSN